MRRALTTSVAAMVVLFIVHALFAPLYETGFARISSPVLFVCFAAPFVALLFRQTWGRRAALTISGVYPVIHVAFFPTSEYYGSYTVYARTLVGIGLAISAATFFLLWHEVAKAKASTEEMRDVDG